MSRLTQKKVKFQWSDSCEKSFQELKTPLTLAPVLAVPNGTDGFVVYCDASKINLGCVLMHRGKYVFTQRELNLRQRRWLELLKNYDMSVLYHSGKDNIMVDSLSRLSMDSVAHVENDKGELVWEVHQLARLGVRSHQDVLRLVGSLLVERNEERYRRIYSQHNSIWIIADRLTKSVPVHISYIAEDYAKLFIRELVRLNKISLSIISDRGTQSTSQFWKAFQKGLGFTYEGGERFGKKRKLSPRYVGPYRILSHVRKVAYELELPTDLSSVHPVFHVSLLKKCMDNLAVIVPLESIDIQNSLSYEELPVEILDHQICRLRNKEVPLVSVLNSSSIIDLEHLYLHPDSGWYRGVVRDHEGNWIVGFHKSFPVATSNQMDLLVLLEGLKMAEEMYLVPIDINMDSKEVIIMLKEADLRGFLSRKLLHRAFAHLFAGLEFEHKMAKESISNMPETVDPRGNIGKIPDRQMITYQDKATQTDIIEDDTLEKILKTLTMLSMKMDSMGNEIEKLKTNEVKLKSEATNQLTQQCAELC
ncbi:hypothetical protein FXO38_14448 [Capsicum annuum]|nr:hypothetical protein FXO38_14448 [Capsicum annuum]